jgi:hypothetical protein
MLLKYWTTQTAKEKLFIVIIAGLLGFGAFTYVKYTIARGRLIKTQKVQLDVYKDSLDITKQLLKDNIDLGKAANKAAKVNSNKINSKLKNDTDDINNSPVTDSELLRLISDYEKKARNK